MKEYSTTNISSAHHSNSNNMQNKSNQQLTTTNQYPMQQSQHLKMSQYQSNTQPNSQHSTINLANQPYQSHQIKHTQSTMQQQQQQYNSNQPNHTKSQQQQQMQQQYQTASSYQSVQQSMKNNQNQQVMLNKGNNNNNESLIQSSTSGIHHNYQSANTNYTHNSSNIASIRDHEYHKQNIQNIQNTTGANLGSSLGSYGIGLMKSSSNNNLSKNDSQKNLNSGKSHQVINLQQKNSNQQFDSNPHLQSLMQNYGNNQEKENLNNKSSTQILQAHLKQQQQLINMTSTQDHKQQNNNNTLLQSNSNYNTNSFVIGGTKLDNNNHSQSNLNVSVNQNQLQDQQSSQSTTNALYQFLKNKHLSKEIQKRMTVDSNQNQTMKSINKSSSKAFMDINNINKKEGDEQLRLYKQQLRQNSSNKKRGLNAHQSLLNNNNKVVYKNFETTSSLSKGSSNNTPSKYHPNNYMGGHYKQQLSSSLKKVKSQTQFNNKNYNYKDQSSVKKQQQQQPNNVRSTTSLNKSPSNLNKSLNFNPPGISNTSSNLNLLLNESMNPQNLNLQKNQAINMSMTQGNNKSQLQQHMNQQNKFHQSKSQTKTTQQQNMNNSSMLNNTALTQNWMNSFLEHYDSKLNQANGNKPQTTNNNANSGSIVRTQQQNSSQHNASQNNYQKFLNNSQQAHNLNKSQSKTGLNIQLNKSTSNINQGGMGSGKHAHGKSISNINQRRGSGMGFSNTNPSTIVVNNSTNSNTHNSSTNNLNKSYQNIQRQQHEHKNSASNLNVGGKTLKKNMSFLAANASSSTQQNQSQTNINQQVNTSSTAQSSKITSAHYSSSNVQSATNKNGVLLQNQPPVNSIQQSNYNQQQNQNRYSSINYHRSQANPTQGNMNNNASLQRKKNTSQVSGHSQNLSLTNNNIQLTGQLYNGSQQKQNAQIKASNANYRTNNPQANYSVIIHNTSTQGNQQNLKHNQSLVLNGNNNLKNIMCNNDNQISFQFDDLLKGLDRQVETQVNPLKKFHLEDDIQIQIVNDLQDFDNESSSPSYLKEKSLKDKHQHNRTGSNITQIKLVDNQSQNRLETLVQILSKQEKSPVKNDQYNKEKLILEIFTDIIQIQKNQSDTQSLSLIKDYFINELNQVRQNQAQNDKYNKLKESFEQERTKRQDAENRMAQVFEQFKKQQMCMTNQEKLLSTLKIEFKKLQISDQNNQTLIKQLYTQSDIKPNQTLNPSSSQVLLKQNSQKDTHFKQQNYQNHSIKDNLQALLKNSQPIQQIQNSKTQLQSQALPHHQKNRSAAINIPKLDLSKIRPNVDQTETTQQNQTEENEQFPSQPSHQDMHNFMIDEDEHSDIENEEESSNFCLNDAEGMVIIEDNIKAQDIISNCDSDEFILNDLQHIKKSSSTGLQGGIEMRESQALQGRKSSVLKQHNQQESDISSLDNSFDDDIRLVSSNNKSVIISKPPSTLIPPLDFSKLKVNQETSQQQKQAQQQYQQQVKQYQENLKQSKMTKQQNIMQQNMIYSSNNTSQKSSTLNQSMSNIYASTSYNQKQFNLNNSINLGVQSLSQSMIINNTKVTQPSKPFIPPLKLGNINQNPILGNPQMAQPQINMQTNNISKGFKLNLDVVQKMQQQDSQMCFQDEFMAKIDEYSLSWREAALKEQRT